MTDVQFKLGVQPAARQRNRSSSGPDKHHEPSGNHRPPFWVEFVIFMIGGYVTGLASALTYDQANAMIRHSLGQ